VVNTELQHHASGCYSVHSGIKQWNRKAENALISAEKWSVVASSILHSPSPDDFSHAWKQLLFNQFHDIMAGTSLEEAYEDARSQIGESISIAERNQNLALQAFAWNINIPEQPEAFPIVVFNPLSWPISAIIELEAAGWQDNALLVDENNTPVPFQAARSHATTWRRRVCFATELPALGYRTYRLINPHQEITKPEIEPSLKATDTSLENKYLRLTIDQETGTLASLFDKTSTMELLSDEGAKPIVLADPGDTWAHGVFEWHDIAGEFKPTQIKLIENGPVKATLRVVSRYLSSTVIQDFSLAVDNDQVEVAVQVNWQEQLKMLKLQFPTTISKGLVNAENAYGHVLRQPNGVEEAMQRWVDLSGMNSAQQPCGLTILNDAKYSYDVKDNILSLTVLRSPVYAHHDPIQLEPNGIYSYIDQGWQHFSYALVPHTGDWRKKGIIKKAEQFNQPPYAMFATFHDKGKLPQQNSFITVESESVMVTVLKAAEYGKGIILRAVESHGKTTSATISLPFLNRTITDNFKAFEIKTYLIPEDNFQEIRSVNVLEL
jgi:alpha-mannosidase